MANRERASTVNNVVIGSQPAAQPQVTANSRKYVPWEPYKAAVDRSKPRTQSLTAQQPQHAHRKPNIGSNEVKKKIAYTLSAVPTRRKRTEHSTGEADWWAKAESTQPMPSSCVDDRSSLAEADGAENDCQSTVDIRGRTNAGVSMSSSHGGETGRRLREAEARVRHLELKCEQLHVHSEQLNSEVDAQSKVNAELKRLVVASMGDDLQVHLESLSHDKVRLGKDIIDYTQQLSQDRENIEQLLIKSDVWRSKYLASSVMVDELVQWKVQLVRCLEDIQIAARVVADEHSFAHRHLLQTLRLLRCLKQQTTDAAATTNHSMHNNVCCSTLLELTTELHSFADAIHSTNAHVCRHADAQRSTRHSDAETTLFDKVLSVDVPSLYGADPCDELRLEVQQRRRKMMGLDGDFTVRNLTIGCCKRCAGKQIQLL